jgi:phosphatidylglycerophosphate synthase
VDRRPLNSRDTNWARSLAATCARLKISPNTISMASVFFAGMSFLFFYYSGILEEFRVINIILAVVMLNFRLLCNLFDGMVAVEYNQASIVGEIYNDFPDRIADLLIILGAATSIPNFAENTFLIHITWLAISSAIITAYIRILGKSMGTESYFNGPMSKPHRMFVITLFSILTLINEQFKLTEYSLMQIAIYIILIGTILTNANRLRLITNELKGKK